MEQTSGDEVNSQESTIFIILFLKLLYTSIYDSNQYISIDRFAPMLLIKMAIHDQES